MDVFNPPTAVINLLYRLGWAWDLKKPSVPLIQKTIESTGNESQRKLNLGFRNSLYEWVTGLAVSTGPLWVLLLWKYTFRYFYLQNNQTSTGLTWNLNHLSF